jgi:hypothetical protein
MKTKPRQALAALPASRVIYGRSAHNEIVARARPQIFSFREPGETSKKSSPQKKKE